MNDPLRTLFVLAGYRASGKTVALRRANRLADFPLFRPSSMPEFRRILKSPDVPKTDSGFYALANLDERRLAQKRVAGLHYDLLLPTQKLMNEELARRHPNSRWKHRTPEMIAEVLGEYLESGLLRDCIREEAVETLKIASAFDTLEFSFIQSNWEANRKDWLERTAEMSGYSPYELNSHAKYNFGLSVFRDNPAMGQELYQLIHEVWYKTLDLSGINYRIVERFGSSYDFRKVAPATS